MFPLASTTAIGKAKPRPARPAEPGMFDAVPLLQPCGERVLASLVKILGAMAGTSTSVDGALVGFRRIPIRDHIAALRPGAVASTLDCSGVDCTILAALDPALVHTIVELLCGGDGSECRPDEMRPATAIDAQYAHTIVTLTAGAIAAEWRDIGFEGAKPLKVEGTPALDICGAQTREVGILSMALTIYGVRGLLTLALPPAALAVFGDAASTEIETGEDDTTWTAQLHQEVGRTGIKIDVLLDALPLSLGQLSRLQPGQIVALQPDARMRATLFCDGRMLYRGELGQEDDRYSLRIDEIAPAITPPTFTKSPLVPSPRA